MIQFKVYFFKNAYCLGSLSWYKTDEMCRWEQVSLKDPWGLLLYLGQSEPSFYPDDAVDVLTALGQEFVGRVKEGNTIAPFETVRPAFEKIDGLLAHLKIDMNWLQNAWQQMESRVQKEAAKYKGSLSAALEAFRFLVNDPGNLILTLTESQESSHPFDLQVSWLVKEKGQNIPKSIEWIKDTKYRSQKAAGTAAHNLLVLARKYDWFHRHLYSGFPDGKAALNPKESMELLKLGQMDAVPGIVWEIPEQWKKLGKQDYTVSAHLGLEDNDLFSAQSLVSLKPSLVINGQTVSREELEEIADMEDGLHYLKGKWTMISRSRLESLLSRMKDYDKDGLTLFDAMRLESGFGQKRRDVEISTDQWLARWLDTLRHPEINKNLPVPDTVNGTLYPYQKTGYSWLNMMRETNLGACLADDMGLGKTLQVLTLLDHLRNEDCQIRSLAVVPASLLENWKKEAARFTPHLQTVILHGKTAGLLLQELEKSEAQLVITTYNMARKLDFLKEQDWEYLILDEAQAIKNPQTKQTHAVKAIPAKHRLALTGTPIENDLSNLWSIFDFLNKGLLGSYADFKESVRAMDSYEKLHDLVQPFLLRRLKTDKTIIQDLPDKIEKVEYVSLSKRQTALYLREIKNLEAVLKDKSADSITRRGRILAALTHFKQICNHPDQFQGLQAYKSSDSGKFEVLKEICETIRDNHECVLVFTQYREIIPSLDKHLADIFGAAGLVLHGQTPVKKRQELVETFEEQKCYVPYMILSLKAGGTGLNLTRASHVIHFDRWWNPAVENQATDRAYRIGQKKNVIVHKMLTSGTIEEHIDTLIESKKQLAQDVIGSTSETWITEMDDAQILDLVRLS